MSEQRLFLRKKVPLPIPIELLPGKEMWLHDIGEGGLSVSGSSRLEPGTATFFNFQFPDANSIIEASGVVAWCDGAGRVGIRFTRIKSDSSAVLKRWLKCDEKPLSSGAEPTRPEPHRSGIEGDATLFRQEIARGELDASAALDLLAERMKDRTRASGAAIALSEEDQVVCRASRGNAPPVGTQLSLTGTATGECYRSGNIVSITDAEKDARVDAELCRQLEFRSLLIVPIAAGEEVVGIVEVFSAVEGNFEGGDILLLGSIAEVAAEIHGAQRRKATAPEGFRVQQISVSSHQAVDQSLPAIEAPGDLDQARSPEKASENSVLPGTEELIEASNQQPAIRPTILPQPAESPADESSDEAENRWKPRTYLLLMAALTVLGVGIGDLVDWHLTSRLARSHAQSDATTTRAGPTVAASQSKLAEKLAGQSPIWPAGSAAKAASGPASSPAKAETQKVERSPLSPQSATASASPSASSASLSIASLTLPEAVPIAGRVPDLDSKNTAQLMPAKLLHRVEPVVPDFAKSAGIEETVLLSAIIGTDGRLKDVKFVSGDRALAIEAFRAVRDWRYRPYTLNGKPVEAETRIVMNFRP